MVPLTEAEQAKVVTSFWNDGYVTIKSMATESEAIMILNFLRLLTYEPVFLTVYREILDTHRLQVPVPIKTGSVLEGITESIRVILHLVSLLWEVSSSSALKSLPGGG